MDFHSIFQAIDQKRSKLKGAPGIYIDDFASDFYDIAENISDIGNILVRSSQLSSEVEDFLEQAEALESMLFQNIISAGNTLYSYVSSVGDYRVYLIKCILSKGGCGYTEGELMRFSVGILENIFVLNHCHDVDYQEVLRYNEEHANNLEGGEADEK